MSEQQPSGHPMPGPPAPGRQGPSPHAAGPQPQAAPGWYPNGLGQQQYWDGQAWIQQPAPAGPGAVPVGAAPVPVAHPGGFPGPGVPLHVVPERRGTAVFAHVGGLVGSYLIPGLGGFIAPAIVYLSNKDSSPYLRHHGAEALNWQVTIFLALIVSVILMVVLIGFLLVPLLLLWDLVIVIIASMAASGGRLYRYPLCLRLFS